MLLAAVANSLISATLLAQPSPLPLPMSKSEVYAAIRNSAPLQVEIDRVRSVTISSAEIDQRWQRVANRPDHPDRFEVETLRALALKPERQRITLAFGKGRWYYREQSSGETSFECAGDSDRRWMLYREDSKGQLTITAAGVPFPSGYNVGQFFDTLVQYVAGVGNWGVLLDGVSSSQNQSENGQPFDFVAHGQSGERLSVRRKSGGAIATFDFGRNDARAVVWNMTTQLRESVPDRWPLPLYAESLQRDETVGFRETWKVVEVVELRDEELNQLVRVPQPPSGAKIRDFSQPGSAPANTDAAVWTTEGKVELIDSTGRIASPGASSQGQHSWSWWLAIAAVALTFAVVFFLRARRS